MIGRFVVSTMRAQYFLIAGLLVVGPSAFAAGDAAKGKDVFEQCGVCHNADSDEKKMGPGLKGLFKKATMADGKTKPTEENVRKKVNEGGNGMPAYEEMLDKGEKDNLIAYLKTL
jgi:cytochrome c2